MMNDGMGIEFHWSLRPGPPTIEVQGIIGHETLLQLVRQPSKKIACSGVM
jgi:hypothetical protein